MEDVKRWSVTYTKHIKQKRKVYQDGLLELRASTGKVMLYDDCEKLLYCKILKKDEVVRSNETLTFDTYLVDVGDPEGDHKPLSDLNARGKGEKLMEKSRSPHVQRFGKKSVFTENTKINLEKNKAMSSNLSPSQRIIREFKKSELHKYEALQSSPDARKSSVPQWQVLYTAQITQKAKKYHDGFLRLSICGSQGRQVMLYDANKKLLDSRFLKKDELIISGESLTFDTYLVDVGEREGNHKPVMKLNSQVCKIVGQLGVLEGEPDNTKANKDVVRRWNALYTSQVTQKSKKYQSGILRLASCGSYRMQVTLLNDDGSTLSSKFLVLSDEIRTGSSIELPKYLVEVGQPWTSPKEAQHCLGKEVDTDLDNIKLSRRDSIKKPLCGGEAQNNGCSGKEMDRDLDEIKLSRRVTINKPLCDGEAQNNGCLGKEVDINLHDIKSSRRVNINKPLRGAHEILSILKKPITQETINPMREAPMEQCLDSQSSDSVHFYIQDAYIRDSNVPKTGATGDQEDEFEVLNKGTDRAETYKDEIYESKTLHTDFSFNFLKLEDSDNKGEPKLKNSASFHPRSGVSDIQRTKVDAVHPDRGVADSNSLLERLQVYCRSDPVILDFSEENQPPRSSMLNEELKAIKVKNKCPEF